MREVLLMFGTNPEIVLFLESDGTDWTYAAGRMTGAETVTMTLDVETVSDGPPLESGPSPPIREASRPSPSLASALTTKTSPNTFRARSPGQVRVKASRCSAPRRRSLPCEA